MKNYLNTLLNEKGISQERILEVEGGEWGINFIPVSVIVDYINDLDATTQAKIKHTLFKIDFYNGNIMHFMDYIAKGITSGIIKE